MGAEIDLAEDPGSALLELYDQALPQVYGYLLKRCGQRTLASLGVHHRAALTLRYVDDLSVAEVAHVLDRTLHQE